MPCGFHLHGLVGCGHLSHACWFSYLLTVCAYLLLFLTELSPLTGSCGSSPCTLGTLSPAAPSLHARLPLSERLSMLKSTLSPPPPRACCSCPRKPPTRSHKRSPSVFLQVLFSCRAGLPSHFRGHCCPGATGYPISSVRAQSDINPHDHTSIVGRSDTVKEVRALAPQPGHPNLGQLTNQPHPKPFFLLPPPSATPTPPRQAGPTTLLGHHAHAAPP